MPVTHPVAGKGIAPERTGQQILLQDSCRSNVDAEVTAGGHGGMAAAHPPVMILGCGRSGTSIFGELFDGLADYAYISEPPFADVIATDFSRSWAFKVPHESAPFPAEPGLSFPLDRMLAVAPAMRFFWIVRHPLDAISSLRIGIAQNWGHHPRPPDWRDWLDRPLVERCAHHWTFLNSAGFGQVEMLAELVHFEAMIADPLGFARSVCARIGVDAEQCGDSLRRWSARVQDSNNAAFVEARTSRGYSRDDHKVRVGRWRENLSGEDVARIWPIVAAPAKRFGYTKPD
jgi:hypothetical protein